MDFKTAFSYMFKDKKFLWVYLTGIILSLPVILSNIISPLNKYTKLIPYINNLSAKELSTIFLIIFVISFILSMYLAGYHFVNINKRISQKDAALPLFSDIKTIGAAAAKFFVVFLILLLGASLALTLLATVTVIIVSIFSKAELPVLIQSSVYISLIILFCIVMVFIPGAITSFSNDLKIKSFFNAHKIFAIIKENKLNYCICTVLFILQYFLSSYLNSFSLSKYYWIALFSPVLIFYINLAIDDLFAKLANNANLAQTGAVCETVTEETTAESENPSENEQ